MVTGFHFFDLRYNYMFLGVFTEMFMSEVDCNFWNQMVFAGHLWGLKPLNVSYENAQKRDYTHIKTLSFPTPIALYTILPWNPTQPTQLSIWAFTPINWSSCGIHWAQLGVPLGSFGFQNAHQLPFSQKFGTMTHAQIRKVSEKNTKWSACVFVVLLKRCAECCRRLDFEW